MQHVLFTSVASVSLFALAACSASVPVAPRVEVEASVVKVVSADANYLAEVRITNRGSVAAFWPEGCHSIERQQGGDWVPDPALMVGCATVPFERLDAGMTVTRSFVLPRHAIIAAGLERGTFRIILRMHQQPEYEVEGSQVVHTPPFRLD